MATGASTADVAILLVDARHGVRPQSRRHAEIARLLGIREFVVAVNKMDLVDFDRAAFERSADDFSRLLGSARVHAIPISALHGDNVIAPSARTPWYDGPGLLGHLETVDVVRHAADAPFRYPVQLVLRPGDGFRGYAGRILSGTVRRGDAVFVWPSGARTKVRRIVTRDGDLELAHAPLSVELTLEDELDVGRGDMLTIGAPRVGTRFEAAVVWMDERPLDPARRYHLKQTTRMVVAGVDRSLRLNEIGIVTVSAAQPLIYDPYADNRGTGSFVLIDPDSHFTAGAGMIVRAADDDQRSDPTRRALEAPR
jgi:sulfate adenylyltransferase subunit 1 (EFTu-like GTPase family)